MSASLLSVLGGGAPHGPALPFVQQHQQQTNWCWSACSTSTGLFYAPMGGWTQCDVAGRALGIASCCQDGSSAVCNVPYYLDRALGVVGHFGTMWNRTARESEVRGEINAGRPIGARIGWAGGGGHFVMLTGYRSDPNGLIVTVQDPWTGTSSVSLTDFALRYKGSGTWTHTYLTRK